MQEFAAGGDLLRYITKQGGKLSERQAVHMVLQPFLQALLFLHTQVSAASATGWACSAPRLPLPCAAPRRRLRCDVGLSW